MPLAPLDLKVKRVIQVIMEQMEEMAALDLKVRREKMVTME